MGRCLSTSRPRHSADAESYTSQMLRGSDYWRTVLDGACGIDVYGNNGVAAGDYDNDGFDDLYVCQPSGLPNRLYRNRGDGTFEDVTEKSGVGVLDNTACALFADFREQGAPGPSCGLWQRSPALSQSRGRDLLAQARCLQVCSIPRRERSPMRRLADYDRDGRLDIYFCLYSYYLGLDQYHYPVPYFDARNGPPNFLLHNEGERDVCGQDRSGRFGCGERSLQFRLCVGPLQFQRLARSLCGQRFWAQQFVSQQRGRNIYRSLQRGPR